MLAIETNVMVRDPTEGHPEQSPQARALIDSYQGFITSHGRLKAEWVLRRAHGPAYGH